MKKSILILTDLSENAKHAAEVATCFAGQLHTNLILLNCDTMTSMLAYYPVASLKMESDIISGDRENKLQLLSESLKKRYADTYPDLAKIQIKTVIRDGDLYANIRDILIQYPIEMLVMGAATGSTAEHLLFGSDTKAVADHSSVPVLIVPPATTVRSMIQITFATNFLEQDINTLHYLAHLRKRLSAHLEIVHIRQYGKPAGSKRNQVQQVIDKMCKSSQSLVLYNEVYGKQPVSRLNHYCKENNSDILALSHQHHSLLFRTFKEGTVDKSLSNPLIPLLIIPDLTNEQETHAGTLKGLSGIVF